VCAHARWCVRECGWWGGLSNFTQAEVALIANCTCNLRCRTVKKRKRPAAAEVEDADADNEMDEKEEEEEEDEHDAPWLQIQANDLPGLDMVAVWNQKRTQAACDFYLAGITGSYSDGKPVAVWFNAGKTSSKTLGDRVYQPAWTDENDGKETFCFKSPGERFRLTTAKYNSRDILLKEPFKLTEHHKIPASVAGDLKVALSEKVTQRPRKQ